MAAVYPGSLWDKNVQDTSNDGPEDSTVAQARDYNEMADEIAAIMSELGYGSTATEKPKGSAANLAARLTISLTDAGVLRTVATTLGGTNITSYTTGDMLYASATNVLSKLAAGTNGYVLTMVAGVPAWSGSLAIPIVATSGGTGFSSYTVGDLLQANTTTTLAKLAAVATGNVLISGGVGTVSSWGKVALTTHVSGTLPVANGGTNITSYTVGDLIYASGTTTLSKLADVATGNALISGGVGVAPSWGKIDVTTHISGVLPVANGGTSFSSYTIGDLIQASATGTLAKLAAVATGNVLISGGVATVSSWGKVGLTTHVSGTLPVANGGTNSAAALNNNRIIVSSSGALVEAAAMTNGQILIGSTGAAPVVASLTGTADQITVTAGAGSITLSLPTTTLNCGICCGRLTLTTALPVTTSTTLTGSTIYFTPFKGNKIALYDGSIWKVIDFTEKSVAVPSTKYRCFDIFGYLNSGVLTLETLNWNQSTGSITGATNASPIVITSTSHGLSNGDQVYIESVGGNTAPNSKVWVVANVTANTFELTDSTGSGAYTSGGTWYKANNTRATALTLQDGVYVKSGDATRRYLGTGCTNGTSGTCEDSQSKRFLWNYSHRVPRFGFATDPASSWTYTSAVYRQANANPNNQVEVVRGLNEDVLSATVHSLFSATANVWNSTGIGINAVATNSAQLWGGAAVGDATGRIATSYYHGQPTEGFCSIRWLEFTQPAGTTTHYGTAATVLINPGLKVETMS